MPQRITNVSVVVYRNGKRQRLQPNTKFDFTADEVENITAAHSTALRKVNSDADDIIDLTTADVGKNQIVKKDDENTGGEETLDPKPKALSAKEKKEQAAKEKLASAKDENAAADESEGL